MRTKTVLITGASGGIGRDVVDYFYSKNWKIIATARNISQLEKIANENIVVLKLDVTNANDIENIGTYITKNSIEIDVLVNNAGYGQFGTIEETSIDLARAQFETNVFGLAALTQKIIPYMRKQGFGRIINVSSIAGKTSMPGGGWYAASKFAVEAISDSIRWETQKFGIKVSIIEPGPIKTDFGTNVGKNIVAPENSPYGNLLKNLLQSSADIKGGSIEECVKTIYMAASDRKTKNRYLVTKQARIIKLLISFLPSKLVDRFVIRLFIKD